MNNLVYIYKLVDPRKPHEIRYIGQTAKPRRRYYDHINRVQRPTNKTHKDNWIRSLLKQGVKPTMTIIELVFYDYPEEWEYVEIFWIKYYRDRGHPLTNLAEGGNSNSGFKLSAETRALLSEIHKNMPPRTEAHRANLSKSLRGRKLPPITEEHKLRISEANKGKVLSVETRAKMSAAQRGRKPSDETRHKQSLAHLGVKMSPERAAKAGKAVAFAKAQKKELKRLTLISNLDNPEIYVNCSYDALLILEAIKSKLSTDEFTKITVNEISSMSNLQFGPIATGIRNLVDNNLLDRIRGSGHYYLYKLKELEG